MHAYITRPDAALRDDPSRTADHGYFPAEECVPPRKLNEADILGVLFDLFAGRTTEAFGEGLEWWNETLRCDLTPEATAAIALSALSKWPFDQRAGTDGVEELRAQLLQRARMLIERSPRAIKEAV